MKTTAIFLFLGISLAFSTTYSQNIQLTLNVRNQSIRDVFSLIEKETEFVFFFDDKINNELSGKVNVQVDSETIDAVLDHMFKGTNLAYEITGRQVSVLKAGTQAGPVKAAGRAKDETIKGVIKDKAGEPVIGANVWIKNSTKGTITGMNGEFSIDVPEHAVLQISYVGYISQEITIRNNNYLEIVLVEDTGIIDEVVVTALGIKKEKKALAYSVTEVKGEEMNRVKTTNIAAGLAGKVAGVNVVKPSSGVMGSSRIIIRGNSSLNGNNQPLYVIDGMPIDNSGYGQAGMWGGNDGGDGISSINSEDIESMSVLKGGTAAALYGSRAANGAIIITTKKGASGKPTVEFNSYFTMDNPVVKNNDIQWEYGQGVMGMAPGEYISPLDIGMLSWGTKLDGSRVIQFDGVERPYVAQKDNFKNFYDNAYSLSNNLSVSGGGQNAQYRVGIGDVRANDLYPGSRLERNNITLSLHTKVTEKFSLQANVMYVREHSKNRPNLGDFTMNGNTFLWIAPTNLDIRTLRKGVDENGNEFLPTSSAWLSNPYFIAHNRKQKDNKDRVIGSLQAQYDITPNIYLRAKAGGDMIFRRSTDVIPSGSGYNPLGSISESSQNHGEFNAEAMLGYKKRFNEEWNVDAFVGWNTMAAWWSSVGAYGSRFIQPGLNSMSNTETTSGSKSTSESFINSVFGQAEVSYKHMLYLTLTGRNDWFSVLSYKDKSASNHIFYPSVGVGFIASEAFQLPDWISFLKFRGSWAESGGGGVGPYSLGLTYSYNRSFGNNPIGSINTGTIPNLNLKPLSTISYEGGFDVRFLDNRLGVDFTYYVRNTKNDIVSAGISSASGYGSVRINAGKVSNRGVELLVTGSPVLTRNFKWNSSFNLSCNKSEIKRITDNMTEFILDESRTGHQGGDGVKAFIYHEVGQPYGIIKGYPYERNEKGEVIYENGLPKQGAITKLGESVHPWTLGFSNEFEYKGFILNILLDARFGGKIFSGTNNNSWLFGKHKGTLEGRETNSITGKGVNADGTPNEITLDPMNYYMGVGNTITEEFIYNASFIKLREISFGYKFPKAWIAKMGMSDLQLSFVGRNLWNIYDKVPLVDPESSFNNGNAQGLEMYGLPVTRSWGFSLNVKF